MEDFRARVNLRNHLIFLGQRDNVFQLLTITDVGVLGFHEERFPNVLLWNIWISSLTYSSDKRSGNAAAVIH